MFSYFNYLKSLIKEYLFVYKFINFSEVSLILIPLVLIFQNSIGFSFILKLRLCYFIQHFILILKKASKVFI